MLFKIRTPNQTSKLKKSIVRSGLCTGCIQTHHLFLDYLYMSGMEKNSHICSWFTSLVTFCVGFTHSGTQQCLCGELFFLHLGMKLDRELTDIISTLPIHRLQMQLSNWISNTGSNTLSWSMEALFFFFVLG